jgi:PTH1 family peptidyl-tRNA hydrolase
MTMWICLWAACVSAPVAPPPATTASVPSFQHFGTDVSPRLKVGIAPADGRPAGERMVGHVLGKFRAEEQPALQTVIQRAADAVLSAVERGLEAAMNVFNRQPES